MKRQKTVVLIGALIALALVAACNKAGPSPTATAKVFFDAVKSKDVQGMKSALSKNSLTMLESIAKTRNQSVDDVLRKGPGTDFPDTFESKEETIASDGNTATLKVKSSGDRWDTLNFVKEDGQWKLAFDKR